MDRRKFFKVAGGLAAGLIPLLAGLGIVPKVAEAEEPVRWKADRGKELIPWKSLLKRRYGRPVEWKSDPIYEHIERTTVYGFHKTTGELMFVPLAVPMSELAQNPYGDPEGEMMKLNMVQKAMNQLRDDNCEVLSTIN